MIVASEPRFRDRWRPVGRTHKTQPYYHARPCAVDYQGYWGTAIDPDGNVRDRLSESEHLSYLGSVADELAFVRTLPPGSMVDYGCGPGWFLRELPTWKRLGIEIAPHAVAELDRTGIPRLPNCDAVPMMSVDLVVCLHVIEHMADPMRAINEMHRMLQPGGWLIISTPDFDSPCAKRFGENYRMLHDKTHCSLFTLESMRRFLRDNGFTIRDLKFPFPAKYANQNTWDRWHDTSKVSPPWPGNWMTFYCQR